MERLAKMRVGLLGTILGVHIAQTKRRIGQIDVDRASDYTDKIIRDITLK